MAHLLVVDDTVETCTMLEHLFRRCGHQVTSLHGGADVVARLRQTRFDLVLLDVMMPDMDGFAVLRAIRGDQGLERVPVAMYSAISDHDAQQRAIDLGANEWIVKGTPFALLRRRLEGFLGSSAPA